MESCLLPCVGGTSAAVFPRRPAAGGGLLLYVSVLRVSLQLWWRRLCLLWSMMVPTGLIVIHSIDFLFSSYFYSLDFSCLIFIACITVACTIIICFVYSLAATGTYHLCFILIFLAWTQEQDQTRSREIDFNKNWIGKEPEQVQREFEEEQNKLGGQDTLTLYSSFKGTKRQEQQALEYSSHNFVCHRIWEAFKQIFVLTLQTNSSFVFVISSHAHVCMTDVCACASHQSCRF